MGLTPQVELLAADWFRRARESQRAHYECCARYNRLNRLLGIPTIVLSAGVGTAVFATLDKGASGSLKVILGLLSVTAAVLASLQTFMAFGDLGTRHKAAGARYGAIRRNLELLKVSPPPSEHEVSQELLKIKKEMDDLAERAPHVPSSPKRKIDEEMKSRDHKRIFDVPASR